MTPETRQAWKGEIERRRAESAKFARYAADNRKQAIELRKRRDFLGALMCDSRAREYRDRRDELKADAQRLSKLYGIR